MSHPHATRLAALSTSLVLLLALVGCSSDDPADQRVPRTGMDASDVLGNTVAVRTSVARVLGEMGTGARAELEREVAPVLGGYLSAAYLHARPGDGYRGSFPGFTPGARKLALADVATVSDAALRDADEVVPERARALLSVVAPEGRAVGATARIFLDLVVTEGGRSRVVAVRGRLLLTPAGRTWRIFGYDLVLDRQHKAAGPR